MQQINLTAFMLPFWAVLYIGDTAVLPIMLSFLPSVALWLPTAVTVIMMKTY